MDSLAALPTAKTALTQPEQRIMRQYFGGKAGASTEEQPVPPKTFRHGTRLVGWAMLLFLAFANRHTRTFIGRQVRHVWLALIVQALVFGVALLIVYRFV